MKAVDRILEKLDFCIENDTYEPLESDKLEIKDNSSDASQWKEVYKSACAFLNTSGGVLIIGIHEVVNDKYVLKGYNESQEGKLKEITNQFTDKDGNSIDLKDYFINFELKELGNKRVLVVYIDKLPDEKKYAFYRGKAWERKLTGDHKVDDNKVLAHEELIKEIRDARELMPVIGTSIGTLDIDKLNEYIHLLNKDVKTENIKPDIINAKSFCY